MFYYLLETKIHAFQTSVSSQNRMNPFHSTPSNLSMIHNDKCSTTQAAENINLSNKTKQNKTEARTNTNPRFAKDLRECMPEQIKHTCFLQTSYCNATILHNTVLHTLPQAIQPNNTHFRNQTASCHSRSYDINHAHIIMLLDSLTFYLILLLLCIHYRKGT